MDVSEFIKSLQLRESYAALRVLSYREREILKLRLGLSEDGHVFSLEEVGHIFKIVSDEVASIERTALEKLVSALGSSEPQGADKLNVLVDPGSATAEEVSELLLELSTLYRMIGGTGITFALTDVREPAIA
jgi:hypothetical protein